MSYPFLADSQFSPGNCFLVILVSSSQCSKNSRHRSNPDDDRIVSHDAPRLGLYHCVRDVIIIPRHGVLSHLSEFRGFCFQEYRFSLYSLRFQGEFCRYSEGFHLCSIGLSRSTNKLCGKHIRTKKSSHPYDGCEFVPVSDICRLQTADCRLQTADCRLQTADCRLQTTDCKLQITDCIQRTSDRRL